MVPFCSAICAAQPFIHKEVVSFFCEFSRFILQPGFRYSAFKSIFLAYFCWYLRRGDSISHITHFSLWYAFFSRTCFFLRLLAPEGYCVRFIEAQRRIWVCSGCDNLSPPPQPAFVTWQPLPVRHGPRAPSFPTPPCPKLATDLSPHHCLRCRPLRCLPISGLIVGDDYNESQFYFPPPRWSDCICKM